MNPTDFYHQNIREHNETIQQRNRARLTNIKMHCFSVGVVAGVLGTLFVARNLPQNKPKND